MHVWKCAKENYMRKDLSFSKYAVVAILLINLISCGGGGGGKSSAGKNSCEPTKSIFSTWTSRNPGNNVYLMQNCDYNVNCQVLFGSAPCNDARGDFTVFITDTGRIGFANCADTIGLDAADWSIDCNNLLRLQYDSDGSVEIFD